MSKHENNALRQDEYKYQYSFDLYPKDLTEEDFKTIPINASEIEAIYAVRKQAPLSIPNRAC